ncbi:MAG TPA: TetR/AcrR family transcriptional regulator C-terminal domain-containing protein [Acidimicrobiales bacterium]
MERSRTLAPATAPAVTPAVGSPAWWAGWGDRLARRRPRADGLTIEQIVVAAIAIVDAEGLDALTVRRIAERFGTGSATLYRHFTSREALLELMVDHVIGEVRMPPADRRGRGTVEWLAAELRRVLMAHAALVPVLATSPLLGPNATRGADRGLAGLIEAGYPPPAALHGYRALLDFVFGTVFFDTSRAGTAGPEERAGAPAVLPDSAVPTLRAHRPALARLDGESVFLFGLRALLDGMERRHLPAPGPGDGGDGGDDD